MHKPYEGGSSELIDIGDNRTITVYLPPVGMVYNKLTGQLEKRDILFKHLPKKDQYWKRLKWPENWEELRAEEEEKQEKNPQYRNPILQKFINQHWDMRINGFWFMNNGKATFLTGANFYYLQTCKLDHPDNDGYPIYYDISRKSFYFREYCQEDPLCLGYINIGPRGIGKTSEEICTLLENMTKTPSRRQAAIQSKSEDDARTKVFKEKIVPIYNELPYFFKPISNHGSNPEGKLSFFRETVKGKGAKKVKYGSELELQNIIYPVSAKETALDGGTYADIFNDEIGKTDPAKEADVYRRMNVNRFCVYRNNIKRGLIRATTTVEEIEKGGKECKMIWDESDYDKRTANGYTISGLYRLFISALDTATQFVDKHGFVDKDKALKFHLNEREARKDDPVALSSYIRKNPFTSEEAFRVDNDKCVFNAMILNDRLGFLNLNPNITQTVDLEWENEVDGPVTFKHNNVNGKFEVAWLPPVNKRNQVGEKIAGGIKIFYPKNDKDFCIGSDPISFGKTVDGRKSNAATYGFRKFDFNEDLGKDEYKIESHNFIIEYIFRPQEPEIFYEDMIRLCRFLGCKILVENQKNNIFTYFKQRGYGEFIMHRPETTFTKEGTSQDTEGIPSSTVMIDTYTGRLQTFVNKHGHRVPFKRLIRDWLEFDPAHPRKFDATVASGFTLLAKEKVVEEDLPQINIEELFDTYDNTGISSSINRH